MHFSFFIGARSVFEAQVNGRMGWVNELSIGIYVVKGVLLEVLKPVLTQCVEVRYR